MEPGVTVEFIQGHQGRGICDTHRGENQCVSERSVLRKEAPCLEPSTHHPLSPYGSLALKSLSQYLWNVVLL